MIYLTLLHFFLISFGGVIVCTFIAMRKQDADYIAHYEWLAKMREQQKEAQ